MAGPAATATLERLALPVVDIPEIELFARLEADEIIRNAAAIAHAAGKATVAQTVEIVEPKAKSYGSLLEATQAARVGDKAARPMVRANVAGEATEQVFKINIRKVALEIDEDGDVGQNGQKSVKMYAHALAFGTQEGEMRRRAESETRFGARLSQAHRAGLLEDHYMLLVSRFSDEMSDEEAKAAHLFVDTKGCSFQLVSEDAGRIELQAAFVAGAPEPGAERHDKTAVAFMGDELGIDLAGDAAELVDRPYLIHKSLLPEGIITLLQLYDTGAGGTHMGQAVAEGEQPMDYRAFMELCRRREAELDYIIDEVTDQLIEDADGYVNPMDPIYAMPDLLKERLVGVVIANPEMDDSVYGPAAQKHIRRARSAYARGDQREAVNEYGKAVKVAQPSGCPLPERDKVTEGSESDDRSGGKRKMKCPFCKDKNQYGDPCAPIICCTNCGATVKNGKVVNAGDGGRAARQARTEKSLLLGTATAQTSRRTSKRDNKPKLTLRQPPRPHEVRRVTGWLALQGKV